MMKNYFLRGALVLGAAAIIGTSAVSAEEAGAWRNVNHLLKNVSGIDGWSGNATGASDRIGEIFYGAGLFYNVIPNAPAGKYTLTAKAFTRAGGVEAAAAAYTAGNKEVKTFIFLDDEEAAIKNMFDEIADVTAFVNAFKAEDWATVDGIGTNYLGSARARFDEGKYACSVEVNHKGGDLYLGIRNYGNMGIDEWTAFGDFKLVGPEGEVTLPEIGAYNLAGEWEAYNADGSIKGRGIQNGGVWSKTNASGYNIAQTVSVEPGKYRLVMQSFNEHFLGSHNGYCLPMKGEFAERTDIPSAKDLYDQKATELGSGAVRGSNEWNPTTFYKMDALEAYAFIYYGPARQGGFDEEDVDKLHNFWMEGDWEDAKGNAFDALADGQWAQVKIKNIFDENLEEYPEANNYRDAGGNWKYLNADGTPMWWESGMNFEAAAFFVANPDRYLNIVELEVTGDKTQEITIGWRKDINQNNYWNPVFNLRLEKWDAAYTGYLPADGNSSVENIVEDANAPVEYYNLQGIRVMNPENGLYIVKQGKKVSKQLIRK